MSHCRARILRKGVGCQRSHLPRVVVWCWECEWLISNTGICWSDSLCHLYSWSCCCSTAHQQPAAELTNSHATCQPRRQKYGVVCWHTQLWARSHRRTEVPSTLRPWMMQKTLQTDYKHCKSTVIIPPLLPLFAASILRCYVCKHTGINNTNAVNTTSIHSTSLVAHFVIFTALFQNGTTEVLWIRLYV